MNSSAQRKKAAHGRIPGGQLIGLGAALQIDRVHARAVLLLGRRELEAHFLAHCARQEPAHRMRLPFGRLHQVLQGSAPGPFQQFEYGCGFAALPYAAGLFTRPALLGRNTARRCAVSGRQALNGLPDTADRGLPVRELLDRTHARQAVPDLDQPRSRPLSRQFGQFFLALEALGFGVAPGLGDRTEGPDVVVLINREDRHLVRSPSAVTFITRVPGTSKRILLPFKRGDENAMRLAHSR